MKSKLLYTALFAPSSISVAAIAAEDMGKSMVMPVDMMDQAEQPIKSQTTQPQRVQQARRSRIGKIRGRR